MPRADVQIQAHPCRNRIVKRGLNLPSRGQSEDSIPLLREGTNVDGLPRGHAKETRVDRNDCSREARGREVEAYPPTVLGNTHCFQKSKV